ncbi:MAG: hypothetical protein ABIF18_04435 [archaeon]
MKKLVVFITLLFVLVPCVLASPDSSDIDSEMQKLTHYAKEYEVGNINYVQLMIHISAVRESMNELLGVTNRELGGVVRQEELENALGKPNEETRWVWVEGEERDTKLDSEVPIWRKIVFDGKKIQIRMEAHPSIFKKRKFEDGKEKKFESIEDGALIYRLNFNTEFKRPENQLDIDGKISEIKSLAEEFSKEPTNSNAKNLAKQSVNAERVFQNYFMQGQFNCEDLMKSIFGSENQRKSQKVLLNEIVIFENENFEALMRLEMCEECEWNWINSDMRFEGRMNFNGQEMGETNMEQFKMKYKGMSTEQLKLEVKRLLNEITNKLEVGDFNGANKFSRELNMLNNAWNEKSNDVWEEVRLDFDKELQSMSEKERFEFDQDYGWIKQDQKQRQAVKVLQEANYQERKEFYLNLFSDYYKKEFYFTQTEFEKRLIEEFKEKGEEICNNNMDDNENEQTDCADSQCGGKICGRGIQLITDGNVTEDAEVDFYCIQGTCQAREKINDSKLWSVCGNHICEIGEEDTETQNGTCQKDCTFETCPKYDAIECSGKVIFGGEDEDGCSLSPICIEEEKECETTEDCAQPSCGVAECVKERLETDTGICKITELIECEMKCESWEQEINICSDGKKIVARTCEDGQWRETGTMCEGGFSGCVKCGNNCVLEEEVDTKMCEEPTEDFYCNEENGACVVMNFEPPTSIVGDECVTIGDCGGEDDVCSNGKCVSIPKVIRDVEEDVEVVIDNDVEENGEMEKDVEEKTSGDVEEDEDVEQEEAPEEREEPEEEREEPEESFIDDITIGISNVLLRSLSMITGRVIEGDEVAPVEDNEEKDIIREEDKEFIPENDEVKEDYIEKDEMDIYEEGDSERMDMQEYDNKERENENGERQEQEREEQERREKENEERCENDCERPCVQRCIRETCGEEMDCDIDEESVVCEKSCVASDDCIGKCMSGEPDWWKEFEEGDMNKEEKGVFQVGGGCRKEKGRLDGYIWFGGWGDPFERIDGLKQEFYTGGEADWCKQDLDNLVKQRKEFEKGFNQEFAQWFFEKYLANAADEWEQAQNGIYEVYWNNVDMQRMFAERMQCLDKNDVRDVMNITPISFEYETEFGKLEYWEEIQTVKMDWMDEETTIISPYMKIWVFPSEDFFKYEMKNSMAEGKFPGPPEENAERENEEGFTEEEKTKIREDNKLMGLINDITEEYEGSADVVLQVVDGEEIVFNLYVQINQEDIMKMKPMLPEEVPEQDVKVQIEFDAIYDLINFEEKNMRGAELESPPWDEKPRQGMVKGFADGIRMYFKVRSLINSAEVTPANAEGDAKDFMMAFIKIMGDGKEGDGMEGGDMNQGEEGMNEKPTMMTGEVTKPVFGFSDSE